MNTAKLDTLVRKVRAIADPAARDAALELVQAVMDLHATGLERMMQVIADSEAEAPLFNAFASDNLVSGILLLHDQHPLDLEARVRRALQQPAFSGRGVAVEVISVRDGIVRVRIERDSARREDVEQALSEAAPDAAEVIVEGGHQPAGNFVPLTQLLAG